MGSCEGVARARLVAYVTGDSPLCPLIGLPSSSGAVYVGDRVGSPLASPRSSVAMRVGLAYVTLASLRGSVARAALVAYVTGDSPLCPLMGLPSSSGAVFVGDREGCPSWLAHTNSTGR
jgi:hypothetical protein